MKQIKRLTNKPLKRTEARLQRLNGSKAKVQRLALDFVPSAENPLCGIKPSGTNEQQRKQELDAIGQAFSKASKQISGRDKLTSYGVDYCVLVFRDADQVDAFLRAVGYPDPKAHYVDGTILADILQIALPAPKVVIPKIKRTQNPRLTKLAMPLQRGSNGAVSKRITS
jgi:hypothetical protein